MRIRVIFFVLLIIFLGTGISFAGRGGMGRAAFNAEQVPQPQLIAPTTETVDLTGKDNLEFKWSPHEGTRGFRRYYDFRLYEGRDTVESTLIFKKQVSPDEYSISLLTKMFDNGKDYTWSLRQVYDEGRKSRRSLQSFKVIKK